MKIILFLLFCNVSFGQWVDIIDEWDKYVKSCYADSTISYEIIHAAKFRDSEYVTSQILSSIYFNKSCSDCKIEYGGKAYKSNGFYYLIKVKTHKQPDIIEFMNLLTKKKLQPIDRLNRLKYGYN